ncbi:MAG TPA: hypothetical protein VJ728_16355 [Candidatus Binataceae bacterium]|nr:hypothetical protein [Candidatus Binataceae bacterium]
MLVQLRVDKVAGEVDLMGSTGERMRINWAKRAAAVVAVVFFFASAGFLNAQGFGALSQLLGGGAFQRSHSSGQSGTAVTVQRGAAPYTGEFNGEERTNSGPQSFNSRFLCYPAHDPAFAQTETFVCYAAQTSAN